MSVSGRDAPTTPPTAFANSSTRGRFSFFWIPRPADTMMSAAARSMSWTIGRSIRSNRVRILVASTATVVRVTVPPAAGPAAFTDPGRSVTTSRSPSRRRPTALVASGRSRAPATAGARSYPSAVWATSRSRGFVDSSRARTACTYPSPVYSARAESSARRTSTPSLARASARARTPRPKRATRAAPPDCAERARPAATSSNVEGASRPSRCSATISRSPDVGSPPDESLVPQERGELLRLLFDRSRHHLRVALRDGRRQAPDRERVRRGERRGRDLPDRLARGLHDCGQRRVARRVRAELDRQEGREGDGVDPLQPAFELRRDLETDVLRLDAGDDARVGHPEEPGDQTARRRVPLVVRLYAGQHEVVRQRPDRGGEDPCDHPDVVPGILHRDADRFVGPLRQRFAQHLLGPLRAGGEGDHPSASLLLEAHRFLEGVLVRAVDLVVQRVPSDVLPVRGDLELQVGIRDLLEAHDDVQGHDEREEERTLFQASPKHGGIDCIPAFRNAFAGPNHAVPQRRGEIDG